ncbi:MAG: hypothetical protein LBG45_11395 [Dysgonamonadaceae bacterium]|jgi:hypothetical protein|nr:hypothetical protein [Dysgonamonadaceae bacterium]
MKNLLLLFILFVSSCNNDDELMPLHITDIQLTDVGQIHYEFSFDAAPGENGTQKCTVKTLNIKKNDTIKYIDGFIQGEKINIDIVSAPYDFDCNEDSCFTVHNVSFGLNGLKTKEYNINIRVNMTSMGNFNYQFKPF